MLLELCILLQESLMLLQAVGEVVLQMVVLVFEDVDCFSLKEMSLNVHILI